MPRTHERPWRAAAAGMTLVELLVGSLVGLVVIVVALDVFATTESRRRDLAGIAEAQQSGALNLSLLGARLASAGHGLAAAASTLATCPDTGDIRTTLRPIPILITPGSNGSSDAVTLVAGHAPAWAGAMPLASAPAPGAPLRVIAPLGIAAGDRIIVASGDGQCASTTVVAVTAAVADGSVEVARSDASTEWAATARLVNLGPATGFTRVRFDVVDGSLRSLDLTAAGAVPNPLASNVALLRAQYGVDDDGDGFLDRWTDASATPWTPAEVLAAPAATLARIRAIRLGLIVRSEAPDLTQPTAYAWSLFDCGLAAEAPCPGRLRGSLPGYRRYRAQEMVIPLRNTLIGAGLSP